MDINKTSCTVQLSDEQRKSRCFHKVQPRSEHMKSRASFSGPGQSTQSSLGISRSCIVSYILFLLSSEASLSLIGMTYTPSEAVPRESFLPSLSRFGQGAQPQSKTNHVSSADIMPACLTESPPPASHQVIKLPSIEPRWASLF